MHAYPDYHLPSLDSSLLLTLDALFGYVNLGKVEPKKLGRQKSQQQPILFMVSDNLYSEGNLKVK